MDDITCLGFAFKITEKRESGQSCRNKTGHFFLTLEAGYVLMGVHHSILSYIFESLFKFKE